MPHCLHASLSIRVARKYPQYFFVPNILYLSLIHKTIVGLSQYFLMLQRCKGHVGSEDWSF